MALPAKREIPEGKFPEKIRRFIARSAPTRLKLLVARGLVPMPPLVQLSAMYQLSLCGDSEVVSAVGEALGKLPKTVLRGAAGERMLPVVLDWLADSCADDEDILETIVLNRVSDDETIGRLARKGTERLTETIARNQERLLRSPDIIEALYYNRNTRASTADRIVDFAARSGVDLSHLPGFEQVLAAIRGEKIPEAPEEIAAVDEAFKEAQSALEDLLGETDDDALAELFNEDAMRPGEEEAEEPAAKRRGSSASRIRELGVPQKVRLALMGNKSERAILIRDSNKIVSRSVINSPALSDQEVISFAGNKNLSEEIIAVIAKNRKWTRHYKIKLSLTGNPRTPLAFAIGMLKQLRFTDVRNIARSKNVSGAVSNAARAMVKARL